MCGIIGYVGTEPAGSILLAGLDKLEYRGYDSAGVALANDSLSVQKTTDAIDTIDIGEAPTVTRGLGHTRWSTHGAPTHANAHPHTDCHEQIAVVHNGILDNHQALKAELSGHTFESETDTEVIPHLLEEAMEAGHSLHEAVEDVTARLEGSFAFCAIHTDTNQIVGTRRGSPLVLGHAEHGYFLASDVPAFLDHTDEVTFLEDGEIVVLEREEATVYEEGTAVDMSIETVDWDPESAEKGGFAHFMRKEIHEQPRALRQAISDRLDRTTGDVRLEIGMNPTQLDTIHFVAAGTSYFASTYGTRLLRTTLDVQASAFIASEYAYPAGADPDRTLVVGVTQSGETKDTLNALEAANAAGAHTLAITNVRGSSVTRTSDQTIFIRAGPEIAVASTKAFSGQAVVLAMLSVAIGRRRGCLTARDARSMIDDIAALPGAVQQVLDHESTVTGIAERYLDASGYFFVGRNLGYPVALEGALKLKEISYAHAEGFPAGELKHGPLALVDAGTPILAVLTNGADPDATMHNVREAQTRAAPAIGIVSADRSSEQLDECLPVPSVGILEPLLANVYFQLFAYHTANALGRPIDKPRNLAKSVTVE